MIWVIISLVGILLLIAAIAVLGGWITLLYTLLIILGVALFLGFIYSVMKAIEYLENR